ncbi:MAG: DNA polymerase III subunit beta [Candidatus Saccharibacteria bacterium]|nr:DNA polymerase III subunit beta [Candidatus Saccharibacteria bacterium]
MRIKIEQSKLAKALATVSRVARSGRGGLPILNNVLIRVEDMKVSLTATNLDMAVVDYVPVSEAEDGSITVPATLFSDFVSNLPGGDVEIELKDDKIVVKSGKYKSIFNGVGAEEFPELPEINEKNAVIYKMRSDEFREGMGSVKIAVSNDTTRPTLTGVYFDTRDGDLYIAATDGYRLTMRKFIEKVESEVKAIVPASSINEVLNDLKEDEGEIEILFENSQVKFRFGEIEVTSNLIDGSYPDYQNLLPNGDKMEFIVSRTELVRTVKMAALFARGSNGSIAVDVNKDSETLSISSILNEYGENTSEIKVKDVTNNMKMVLTARYFLDALNAFSDADVKVVLYSGCQMILTGSDSDNYKHLVMPLRGSHWD